MYQENINILYFVVNIHMYKTDFIYDFSADALSEYQVTRKELGEH